MVKKLVENTEPRVQQLFNESYPERDMGPQGLAGVGLCVSDQQKAGFLILLINKKL